MRSVPISLSVEGITTVCLEDCRDGRARGPCRSRLTRRGPPHPWDRKDGTGRVGSVRRLSCPASEGKGSLTSRRFGG